MFEDELTADQMKLKETPEELQRMSQEVGLKGRVLQDLKNEFLAKPSKRSIIRNYRQKEKIIQKTENISLFEE